ncbi:MAG: AAA family ATPase [Actinomycetota bacterium]|nr:AAA family ATPase [Actinomycetota bacterium]
MPHQPFIGRNGELARLDVELEAVRHASTCRLVWVDGTVGIGKTALLRRFVSRAEASTTLWARAERAEAALAGGLLGRIVDGIKQQTHPGRRLRASPAAEVDAAGAAASTAALLHAVAARSGSAVLVVDDVQWSDQASAVALRLIFGRLARAPVLLLIAGHQTEGGTCDEDWRRLLAADDRVSQIALGGLSTPEVRLLAQGRGRAIGLPAAKRLRQHTNGNPLHLNEMLEQVDPAALAIDRGPLPAPRSVQRAVATCMASSPTAVRDLVGATAVLCERTGGGVRLAQVADLADLGDALGPLADAVAAGLLAERPGIAHVEVGFRDNLVRTAVYEGLSLARRASLHARAADLTAGAVRLDHQVAAVRGCGGPYHGLIAALEATAQDEAAAGALALAARHLEQAAHLSEETLQRSRLLLDAAELLLASGDAAGSQARISEAALTGSSPRMDLLSGQLAMLIGQPDTAHRHLVTAWTTATSAAEVSVAAQAAAALGLLAVTRGHAEQAMTWASRARDGTPAAGAQSIFVHALGMALCGRAEAALAALADSTSPRAAVLLARGVLHIWTDDLRTACTELRASAALAHEEGLQFASHALAFLADAEYRCGNWTDSIIHAERAALLSTEAGRVCDAAVAHTMAVRPLVALGDWAAAQAHLDAAVETAERVDVELLAACTAHARGVLAGARGDYHTQLDAVRAADAACAPAEPAFFPEPSEAEALVGLGRLDEATAVMSLFEQRAVALDRRSALAGADRLHGRLAAAQGRPDQALVHFEAALVRLEGLNMPFEEARLRLDQGRALIQSHEFSAAEERVRRARSAFRTLEATPHVALCDEALEELHRARSSQRPATLCLTPAETRVAELVAAGLSNREVAEQLSIASKTVESHLARAYAKLGVSRRGQLPRSTGPGRRSSPCGPPD